MGVVVTTHSIERIKERVGLSKKDANKIAEKALEFGIKHNEVSGSLKRFLDALYLSYKVANNIRIYSRKVYLFKGEKLITVINLPNKYHNAVDKINKRKRSE